MTLNEMEKRMRDLTGCEFITKKELARFMGYKRDKSVASIVYGLDRVQTKYYIPEVARRLMEKVE